jgi:hypothetical protein
MIQALATKYRKHIAYCSFLIFYTATVLQAHGMKNRPIRNMGLLRFMDSGQRWNPGTDSNNHFYKTVNSLNRFRERKGGNKQIEEAEKTTKGNIGGPTQPEMSRFKPTGVDNLVDLFTGNFSYNIPLLDVGGYPVNIFYNGGVTPEDEASWVGLGWNINPGTVSRNMRGVPDDFNGTEQLTTTQSLKPNVTVGGRIGGDIEFSGIKDMPFLGVSLGASLGVSTNNYLGPAIDIGMKGGVSFKMGNLSASEQHANDNWGLKIGTGLNADLSSRGGLTMSPYLSLTASKRDKDLTTQGTVGASISYNSRTGIGALQLSGQASFSRTVTDFTAIMVKGYGVIPYATKRSGSISQSIMSSSISFTKPSYIPSIRMPVTNESLAGHFQLGAGIEGIYGSAEVEVYKHSSYVADANVIQHKPLVGYLYYNKANGNPNAVEDFTRLNDKEVTPHTPIISAPQYSYDVFMINGEGTGGSIRFYRNDYGTSRDNTTRSIDKSLSLGGDIGIPGHFGANVNGILTPSRIAEWVINNKARKPMAFSESKELDEAVYFRNPGETSVLSADQFNKIGGTDLVRYKLGGDAMNPSVEPVLERMATGNQKLGEIPLMTTASSLPRKKRTQVVNYFTAEDAAVIGLNKRIKSYSGETPFTQDPSDNNAWKLNSESFDRVSEYRLPHQISQINVTEAGGSRYIYDLPVYNSLQKDFTFTVATTSPDQDLVTITSQEPTKNSSWLSKTSSKDGYLQVNETPAYAHSFLLEGLLSPDYVDVTGDGITEDDLGTAVKFNYTRIKASDGGWAKYRWRAPHGSEALRANFSPGNRSEVKDDKGNISYGERESWYLHSIESKTMIALFTLENRQDGKGAIDELGGRQDAAKLDYNALKRLKRIDLYNKADLRKNGIAKAKPIKSVFFQYSYRLCGNSTDNSGDAENQTTGGITTNVNSNKGKLTLERVWFTFNGQERSNKNQYRFVYENSDGTGNPNYAMNTSDRWGTYKPSTVNPDDMRNADYPYSFQPANETEKGTMNQYAAAWDLKKILLPSGGQIEVEYESDDYAFVQDKRAALMMNVAGFGKDKTHFVDALYSFKTLGFEEHKYVLINIPEVCTTKQELKAKYLQGIEQLAFKLWVHMVKGDEYVNSYAEIDDSDPNDNYDVYGDPANKQIWIKLKLVNGISPLSLTALEYLKERLPGQAFAGYDVSEGNTLEQISGMLEGLFTGLRDAFRDPIKGMRLDNKARHTNLLRCFVRLNDPDGHKYGGGHRVRKVILKDNWTKMTEKPGQPGQFTSQYGSEYDYTTTEIINGETREISSGVASYEPSIGGDENPFQTMVQVVDKLPLGPSSYGAIEMPVLDAFFPAPVVGYSKVTVRSIRKGNIPANMKTRSGIGRQVTEFYTAKDFPVRYTNTLLDGSTNMQVHKNNLGLFFYKWAFDARAISQGFLVATNDMHGKIKSQSSYAENDPTQRISYTETFYRNTGVNGLDEKFDFVSAASGGVISQGNMGIDIELMTDSREFSVKSLGIEVQVNVDYFPIIPPPLLWLPFIWPVFSKGEDVYRAVTCTKVINYHSIVDSVIVIDKGSKVGTRNLVFDAETGGVIVTRTNNEFNKPIYTVNYPAYWAYSGMGLAYKNIDALYSDVTFVDGKITSNNVPASVFESGDELYVYSTGTATGCDAIMTSSGEKQIIWALDKNKNGSALTDMNPDYIFIDKEGKPYSRGGVKFRIVRSGKRNMLSAPLSGVAMMADPVVTAGGISTLVVNDNNLTSNLKKVISGSSVEYKEKWQTDGDAFFKLKTVFNPETCAETEEQDCSGYLEKKINPYRKGLLGNFRGYRNRMLYVDRSESNPTFATNLPENGFLMGFKSYWNFNSDHNLVPESDLLLSKRWVPDNEITRVNAKGMELETKNALGIATSAQYGYNKTTPIAIANNSSYHEMFFDGFEDYNYRDILNYGTAYNLCSKKHISFDDMQSAQIVDAEQTGFKAHSGQFALKVIDEAVKTLPVGTAGYNFDLAFVNTGVTGLINLGGNGGFSTDGQSAESSIAFGNFTMHREIVPISMDQFEDYDGHNSLVHRYTATSSQYMKVTIPGDYHFVANSGGFVSLTGDGYTQRNIQIRLIRVDDSGNDAEVLQEDDQFTIHLCKGIYKVICDIDKFQASYTWPQGQIITFANDVYDMSCTGPETLVSYKNLATSTVCTYSKPIAASESFMNPTFTIPAGKKMMFSAWVKEDCGNPPQNSTPCNLTTYTDNEVEISFGQGNSNNVILKPSGPIIEGWQRYEGYFTAPVGTSQLELHLRSLTHGTVYFDDIRVHPFNASMESYIYDPVNLRLTAQLDANNYGSFYEYDSEGGLIRTKAETKEGIKTIGETRSSKQKTITEIQ